MERRRFLTLAGSALVVAACDGTAPESLPTAGAPPTIRRPTNALVARWETDPCARGSYSYLAFTRGFKLNDFGYASAMSFLLLIVVMIIVTLFFGRIRKSYE